MDQTRLKQFGQRVRDRRIQLLLSQCELSAISKIHRPNISQWERGLQYPNVDKLVLLARILHVSTDWLLGVEGT